MPRPHPRSVPDYLPGELREIALALSDQAHSLTQLSAAAYKTAIDRSLSALAKTLVHIGQKVGDRCFLCRKPLVLVSRGHVHCPDGCPTPAAYLRRLADAE